MESVDLVERLETRTSRRTVVKTGAKLAYAAPLVAVSFKLSMNGALAAVCPSGYEPVAKGPSGGPECCKCACTTSGVELRVDANGAAVCIDPAFEDEGPQPCLVCTTSTQSLP